MLLASYIQQYFNTSITVLTNRVWKLVIALFKVPNTGAFTVHVPCTCTLSKMNLVVWSVTVPVGDSLQWADLYQSLQGSASMLLCLIDVIHLLWRQLSAEVVESVVSGSVNKFSPKSTSSLRMFSCLLAWWQLGFGPTSNTILLNSPGTS